MGGPTDRLDVAMSEAQTSHEAFMELAENISFSLPEAEASATPAAAAAAAEADDFGPALDFLAVAYEKEKEDALQQQQQQQQHREQQYQAEQQLQQEQPPTPPWKKARLRTPVPPPRSSGESQPRLRSPERPPAWAQSSASSSSQPGPFQPEPRREVSFDEFLWLRAEQQVAQEMGLRWQERGPPPEALPEGQTTWRGQAYRPGTGKWANRGGANKQWFTEFYRAKKAGPAAVQDFLAKNPEQ